MVLEVGFYLKAFMTRSNCELLFCCLMNFRRFTDAESFAMERDTIDFSLCVLIGVAGDGGRAEPDVLSKEHFVK